MRTGWILVLVVMLVSVPITRIYGRRTPAPPIVIKDDFASYAPGSHASKNWEVQSGNWEVRHSSFESMDGWKTFATPVKAPYAKRMILQATISLHKPAGTSWKLAGLAFVYNNNNYWHYTLCERPDKMGGGHFCELAESYQGNWLAQSASGTALQMTANEGADFNWRYDHPYRFKLTITPEGVEGTISELDGTVRCHQAYRFNNAAVTDGRPALTVDSEVASFSQFSAVITAKGTAPPKPIFPPYHALHHGIYVGKRTGYFHVQKIHGKWWIIDPLGRSFYAVGTDHVNWDMIFCEKLGYAPYHRNIKEEFGTEEKWAENSVHRLKEWNFNTLGAGCSASTYYKGLPYTAFLSLGANFSPISDITPKTTWTGFPDVFDPMFPTYCLQQARLQCAPVKGDPWLLGYFLDNELEWFGKDGAQTGLVDETFKKPPDHPAKVALMHFLQARYPTIDAFNKAWGLHESSWSDFAKSVTPPKVTTKSANRDEMDFVRLIADKYFSITTKAIREVDPHHMILGCRFAGTMPDGVMSVAGKYCDIVSVNYYGRVDLSKGYSPDMPGIMRKYYAEAKRPLMLTEWSFPALDAGLPSQHGAGQRVPTQKDKAFCYAVYQRTLFSLPFMVGSDYFMWVDEPALGVSSTFPEDSNYGLVDVNNRPWAILTRMATRINAMAQQIHAGKTAKLTGKIFRKANGTPVVRILNVGAAPASFDVDIRVGAENFVKRLALSPGESRDIPLHVHGSAYVQVNIDPKQEAPVSEIKTNRFAQTLLDPNLKKPCVVIVNRSDVELDHVPISFPLRKIRGEWTIENVAVKGIKFQTDDLPSGREMAILLPRIHPYEIITLPLIHGEGNSSRKTERGDESFVIRGVLTLSHTAGTGGFFNTVSLGNSSLGSFGTLVHETGVANQWVAPSSVSHITEFSGPVRVVLIMTADHNSALEGSDGDYQVTFRMDVYPQESWFGARMLRLKNTDTFPWRCESYFMYPVSDILADASGDTPHSMDDVQVWNNLKAGLSYGALFDISHFSGFFWKDTPTGKSEHADIYRNLNITLVPGQEIKATSADTEVYVFGAAATAQNLGGAVLPRLRAWVKIKAWVLP